MRSNGPNQTNTPAPCLNEKTTFNQHELAGKRCFPKNGRKFDRGGIYSFIDRHKLNSIN